MIAIEHINTHILSAYPEEYKAEEVFCLSQSSSLGMAEHWRVRSEAGLFCLRRWPKAESVAELTQMSAACPTAGPTAERLQFIQAVQWQAVCEGIDFVPLPIETLARKGFVKHRGRFWELLPWISGNEEPEFFEPALFPKDEGSAGGEKEKPACAGRNGNLAVADNEMDDLDADGFDWAALVSPERNMFQVVSAMMSLAQFHQAVAAFPLPNPPLATSAGIRHDLSEWEKWISGKITKLFQALRSVLQLSTDANDLRLAQSGLALLNHVSRLAGNRMVLLSRAARLAAPVQPVLGNACRRHFRFDDDGVCGILDMKEIAVDSVALDVATLLGSLAENDAGLWQLGLKAYTQHRPLSDNELFLLEAFARSRVVLEGLGYLSQHFLLRDRHDRCQALEMGRRLERILLRLDGETRSWKTA